MVKKFILILLLSMSACFAQEMNTKGVELYERAVNVQRECVKRIIKFNRLLKSNQLTYSQEKTIKKFKKRRITIYKKMENVKAALEKRRLITVFRYNKVKK